MDSSDSLHINHIPSFILELDEDTHQVTYINAYALSKLESEKPTNLSGIFTKGSLIYLNSYLLSCFTEKTIRSEIYLTVQELDERVPYLFNISKDQGATPKILFSGIPIPERIQYERKLLTKKEEAEFLLHSESRHQKLKEELSKNQLSLERKLKKLSRINQEQEELYKVLGHDLQEPIRKIITFSELSRRKGDKDQQHSYLEKIGGFAERAQLLLRSVQTYYTIRESSTEQAQVNVEFLIASIIAGKGKEISCTFVNPKGLTVLGDSIQLHVLFRELIKNTLQFTENGDIPSIEVTVESIKSNAFKVSTEFYELKDYLRISYRDSSIGIEKRYSKKVFGWFQKLTKSDRPGLGLSYCKKIVELHRGEMEIQYDKNGSFYYLITFPTYN